MKQLLNRSTSLYFLMLTMLFGMVEATKKDHKGINDRIKYVQGGACGTGKGTKKHPYHSLAQAQADSSWKTLVVLPSTIALDGGITLRPGTKLIGTRNPTGIALSPTQPTITNSSDATNGGNGVVVTGDAVIENIYFKDTWASGIRYDDAQNLCVKQVLTTGFNQGEVLSPANGTGLPPYEVAAIHGQIKNNGKTVIEKVIIRNNHSGSGIIEQSYQGAQRTFHVKSSEFAELTSANLRADINVFTTTGLVAYAIDQGTNTNVTIENVYMHDFVNNARAADLHAGFGCFVTNGGKQTAHITNSSFYRLATSDQPVSVQIFAEAFANGSSVPTTPRSDLKLVVDGCSFEELPGNSSSAVQFETDNSTTECVIKNSRITNILDNIISLIGGDSVQKETILNNTASGFEAFYIATTENFRGSFANPQRFTDVTIKDNFFTGGTAFGAIVVLPNLDGSATPWTRLTINAENNCFDGQGTGGAGLLGLDFGTAGAGNATINAHNNSIVGYFFDIADSGANVNYFAQRNWWGQGGPCTTGTDCSSTQICEGGFCVGPALVFNLGTGIVNVSNPLRESIICPNNCCQGIGTTPPQQREAVDAKSKAFEEKLNKFKADFKARHNSRPYGN